MESVEELFLDVDSFVDTYLKVEVNKETNIGPSNRATLLKVSAEESIGIEAFYEQVAACANPEECVKKVSKYFVWKPVRAEILRKYAKNSAFASMLRKKGNEFFRREELGDALLHYNLAIMFAPLDQQLGMAYANRSAVLVQLKDPEGALEDIALALQSKYPPTSIHKLEQRKKKCEEMIEKLKSVGNLRDLEAKLEDEMRKQLREDIRHIQNPNPLIPVAAKCVQIKFDKAKGRHLVVNRDVPAGTTLIVEDPFASILLEGTRWDTRHCHYCLKEIRRGSPCTGCVFVMYCDATCMLKADEEYHKYECTMMDYLHFGHSQFELLPRILFKAGAAELYRIFTTRDPAYYNQKQPYGTEPDCKYDSSSYLTFYHSMDGRRRMPDPEWKYRLTHQALLLASIIENQTDFSQKIPHDRRTEFKHFVASALLYHAERLLNKIVIVEQTLEVERFTDCFQREESLQSMMGLQFGRGAVRSYASGLYPLLSLISHSCDPNVHQISDVVNGTQIIITKRALKTGEQISMSVGKTFLSDSLRARQNDLSLRGHLKCECVACRNNWPLSFKLGPGNPVFCCPSCSKKFTEESRGSPEFKKCCLTKLGGWKCGICRKSYSERALFSQLSVNMKISEDAEGLVSHNRPYQAMLLIEKVSEYFQFHLCPPYSQKYFNESLHEEALRFLFHSPQ